VIFCAVVQQLTRFQLTWGLARSLCGSWAFCYVFKMLLMSCTWLYWSLIAHWLASCVLPDGGLPCSDMLQGSLMTPLYIGPSCALSANLLPYLGWKCQPSHPCASWVNWLCRYNDTLSLISGDRETD